MIKSVVTCKNKRLFKRRSNTMVRNADIVTDADRTKHLLITCSMCEEVFPLNVRPEDFIEYMGKTNTHIQDIFFYLDEGERELILSQTCNTCFDKLFPPE